MRGSVHCPRASQMLRRNINKNVGNLKKKKKKEQKKQYKEDPTTENIPDTPRRPTHDLAKSLATSLSSPQNTLLSARGSGFV